ncbi:MAG: hypothetical protein KGR22_11655 [Planctomycetes bacterium]|nr:hypothetical protein [Planctomycetota bacterium]
MRHTPFMIVATLITLTLAIVPASAQDGCDAKAADLDGSGSVDAGDISLMLLYFGEVDPCCGIDCDDHDPNTVDSCVNGTCQHVNPCDDGIPCTIDAFDPKAGTCTHTYRDCDDGNTCTADSCVNGNCVHTTNVSSPCDDGNLCTGGDACFGGQCTPGFPVNCNDGNPCTIDYCNPCVGCLHVPGNCLTSDAQRTAKVGRCALAICGAMPTCCEVAWDDTCLEFAASIDVCTDIDQLMDRSAAGLPLFADSMP